MKLGAAIKRLQLLFSRIKSQQIPLGGAFNSFLFNCIVFVRSRWEKQRQRNLTTVHNRFYKLILEVVKHTVCSSPFFLNKKRSFRGEELAGAASEKGFRAEDSGRNEIIDLFL